MPHFIATSGVHRIFYAILSRNQGALFLKLHYFVWSNAVCNELLKRIYIISGKHVTESFSSDHAAEAVEHDVISDQRQQVKQSHPPGSPSLTCRLCLESVSGVAELESHLVQVVNASLLRAPKRSHHPANREG